MSEGARPPQQFAGGQSHGGAEISNETAMSVLDYLAKATRLPLLGQAPLCLFDYTTGVASRALMLLVSIRPLVFGNARWRLVARPHSAFSDSRSDYAARSKGFAWYQWPARSFAAAMSAILTFSSLNALALANQRITARADRFALVDLTCATCMAREDTR